MDASPFASSRWDRPEQKGEIMSPDYMAQREALVGLSVAYENARDFTRQVLLTAFGNVALGSVPPPSECVWPPDITQAEANSRLQAVRHLLAQTEAVFKNVLRDIDAAQNRLVNSGFDVPRSWIITDPLHSIRGWYLGACGVEEIVRNAASEDSALQTAVEDIAKDVKVYLKSKIAGGHSTKPLRHIREHRNDVSQPHAPPVTKDRIEAEICSLQVNEPLPPSRENPEEPLVDPLAATEDMPTKTLEEEGTGKKARRPGRPKTNKERDKAILKMHVNTYSAAEVVKKLAPQWPKLTDSIVRRVRSKKGQKRSE